MPSGKMRRRGHADARGARGSSSSNRAEAAVIASSNLSSACGPDSAVTCATWINASKNVPFTLLVLGKADAEGSSFSAGILQLLSYDHKSGSLSEVDLLREVSMPLSIAVHPQGDGIMVSSSDDCKFFYLDTDKQKIKRSNLMLPLLKGVGQQKCLAFSFDGSKFAMGGEDGHLRVYEWPSMKLLLDQPKAHRSFKDLDFSLDSAFLASTSDRGPAKVWDVIKRAPLAVLASKEGEQIDLCRFSQDGSKPFLFCTVTKGGKGSIEVWNISTWEKLGFKKLLDCPISAVDVSHDGKFLAIGGTEGNVLVVEVGKMEARYSIRRAHARSVITSLKFASSGRHLISISPEWALKILSLPENAWKEWQIYLVLLSLFLISAILCYIFFEHSDSFWNFPLGRDQPARPSFEAIFGDGENRW